MHSGLVLTCHRMSNCSYDYWLVGGGTVAAYNAQTAVCQNLIAALQTILHEGLLASIDLSLATSVADIICPTHTYEITHFDQSS